MFLLLSSLTCFLSDISLQSQDKLVTELIAKTINIFSEIQTGFERSPEFTSKASLLSQHYLK